MGWRPRKTRFMGKPAESRAWPLLLGLAFLALSACGLERLVYLAPITEFEGGYPSPNKFTLYHNTDNDAPEFLGYELFYKFYDAYSGTLEQDFSADRTYFYERYIGSYSAITGRGFFRARENDVRPLLPFNHTETIRRKMEIDFVDLTLPNPTVPALEISVYDDHPGTNVTRQFILKRDAEVVEAGVTRLKDFLPGEILPGDRDTAGLPPGFNQPGRELVVSLCVAAYGRNIDGGPLFSEVVFLNYDWTNAMRLRF